MSVNFGYGGYGMMMNNMYMMNSMMNGGMMGGNTFQNTEAQYSCPACYQNGPIPHSYKTYVNPIPPETPTAINWVRRIFGRVLG